MKIIAKILLFIACGNFAFAESNFSGERLQSAMIKFVTNAVKNAGNGVDAEVIITKDIDNFKFDQDKVTAKFDANPKSLRGNCFVGLEFFSNELLLKRVEYPIRVKVFADCPILIDNKTRGEIISENDILLERRDVSIYKNQEIPFVDEIIGKKAIRNLSKNSIIKRLDIQTKSMISRGDAVDIVSVSGSVSVRLKGVALTDAGDGEKIRVRKADKSGNGKQIFEGVVAGDDVIIKN